MRIGVCERARQHEKAHLCANDRGPGQTDRRDGRPERACAGRGVWARAASRIENRGTTEEKHARGPTRRTSERKLNGCIGRWVCVCSNVRSTIVRILTQNTHTHTDKYTNTLSRTAQQHIVCVELSDERWAETKQPLYWDRNRYWEVTEKPPIIKWN